MTAFPLHFQTLGWSMALSSAQCSSPFSGKGSVDPNNLHPYPVHPLPSPEDPRKLEK